MLDRYFASARREPSLMSGEDARDLLAQSAGEEVERESGPTGRAAKVGVASALVAGSLLVATLLINPFGSDRGDQTADQQDRLEQTSLLAEAAPRAQGGDEDLAPAQSTPESSLLPAPESASLRQGGLLQLQPMTAQEEAADLPDEISDPLTEATESRQDDQAVDAPESEGRSAPTFSELTYYRTSVASVATDDLFSDDGGVLVEEIAGLNSGGSQEYNPLASPDGRTLYFTSSNVNGLGGHDIWISNRREGSKEFSAPVNIGSGLNSSQDEGGVTLTGDGRTMIFTSCERSDGLGDCDLYEARLTENGWEEVRNLRELNTRYWESHPTVAPDGREIYFISNRPGTLGGYDDADIWVAHRREDGSWTRPENIGRPINTKEPEDSPFITPGGEGLYFSSKGHESFGGFDFFFAERNGSGEWGRPENIGPEINTRGDERFLSVSAGEHRIYFARQDRGGDYNLYMAERKPRSEGAIITGTIRRTERNDYIRADLIFVDHSSGEILGEGMTAGGENRFSLLLGPDHFRSGGTIDLYGLADSLGEFRGGLELPPRDSWGEYRFDLRIDTSRSSMAATNPATEEQIDRGITTTLQQGMLLIQGRGLTPGPIRIFNSRGTEVLRRDISPEQTGADRSISIDVSRLPDGLYLVRSTGEAGLFRKTSAR